MRRYYVYCHCFSNSNVIFYIGKGTGKRLTSKQRKPHWHSIVQGKEYYALKIRDNLTQDEAILLEDELIREFQPIGNIQRGSFLVKPISYEEMSKILKYDETSPTFLRYIVDRANGAIKAGSVAGSFDSEGYGQVYVKDKLYKIHRIIVSLQSKKDLPTDVIIDHIDGNKSNNCITNLRISDYSLNAKNIDWASVKPSNTGHRGISLRDKSYRVLWVHNKKQYEKNFCFGPRGAYTQEEALAQAISLRDALINDTDPNSYRESTQNQDQP